MLHHKPRTVALAIQFIESRKTLLEEIRTLTSSCPQMSCHREIAALVEKVRKETEDEIHELYYLAIGGPDEGTPEREKTEDEIEKPQKPKIETSTEES